MARIAILLLNPRGSELAARLKANLEGAEIWGLKSRVAKADTYFDDFGATLRGLYGEGVTLIGICAAGILIRALAPCLSDKRSEAPVLAISDDGQLIVPLLGGLTGANELSREIAESLGGIAAITASGSRAYGLQLEAPPAGYVLANPKDAKNVTSALLAGSRARLEGEAPWLADSGLPFAKDGEVLLKVTPRDTDIPEGGLLYHSRCAIVLVETGNVDLPLISSALEEAELAPQSLALIVIREATDYSAELARTAQKLGVDVKLVENPASTLADLEKLRDADGMTIYCAAAPVSPDGIGRPIGKLTIVGLGPGDAANRTPAAREALEAAEDLVGYKTYLNLVPDLPNAPERHGSDNRVELDRARAALDLAARGRRVVLVSSGDPGIFAMASAVMEALEDNPERWPGIEIDVVPGISAMQMAAARVGAPLGHDFAVLSLSDIRKPWDVIAARLEAAARADFVIAIYNPASKSRCDQIVEARDVLLAHRSVDTPVILGRNLGRDGETTEVIALGDLVRESVDMRTVVIVGSSHSRTFRSGDGRLFAYAPRSHETS